MRSSKTGGSGAWRWLSAAILLFWLSGCQGEAFTQASPRYAATQAGELQLKVAASDSPTTQAVGFTPTPSSVVAAGLISSELPNTPTPTIFQLPSATPQPTRPLSSPAPSATPDCVDGLLFLVDLTIPDGTVVTPGTILDKRWRVQNSGSCNWDGRYRVRRISGPELGLEADQALFPARSGTEAVIRLLLTAPNEPGAYRSAWQAINPLGEPFGDPIFVEIIVATSIP